jgi:hypothetical protein
LKGNRIIKELKKKKKQTIGKSRRGRMDIRANLAIIPDPRIARCKKHLLTDILLFVLSRRPAASNRRKTPPFLA